MRVGSIGYPSPQGLGHLMKWFFDAGVITDVMLVRHPRHPHHPEWYPPDTPEVDPRSISGPAVNEFLGRVQAVLFWETPFDWSFIDLCRARGVKTALCVMHEWYPIHPPAMPDLIIAPSLLDKDYFPDSVFLPIPVPPRVKWQKREKALRFLHNAGHVGHREHKGTRQLLEALRHVRSPFQLTVRCQYGEGMIRDMAESAGVLSDPRLKLEGGYLPYESLWDGFDVYVAPEKLNGLSLPLQEAHAAGLMVMTTDRYPANTWLPAPPLIPVAAYRRARVSASCYEVDEAVVEPLAIAETIDRWFGQNITAFSLAGKEWAERHSWAALLPLWRKALAS